MAGRFWKPSSSHLVQAPLTDEAIVRAERLLDVRLPSTYLELLREQNGGVVAADYRRCPSPPNSWANDHVPFRDCFGIGEGRGSITNSPALNEEWGQPPELVLLHGDGHWWIALDYRSCGRSGEPPVVWYDNERGEEFELARDFRSFLSSLGPDEDLSPASA